ncbi:phage tail fiber protein [Pseudomonas sp. NPDC098747]|uniref:phage tail fiber protein n=1 Tax=Pseudomonas sp. NPDC098747 TaxID=3364487 RepID=UPI00383B479E
MAGRKGNITSANSTGIITVDELFPNGFLLENYATDAAIAMDEETVAETRMGVDGKMVAGYVPSIKVLTLSLEAISEAAKALDLVNARSHQNMAIYHLSLSFSVPGLRQTWTFQDGVLKSLKSVPDVKKVLDIRTFKFDFESLDIQDW